MPVRPKIQPLRERRINPIAFLISDGTHGFTGDPVFPDHESARKAWPDYRRDTWAKAWRGGLPASAKYFDDLTTSGAEYVRSHWQDEQFDLSEALAAIEDDRAAVRAFEQRDPRGARDIRDYLEVFRYYLDRTEDEARRLAASTDARYSRGYPTIGSGRRYGDLDPHPTDMRRDIH